MATKYLRVKEQLNAYYKSQGLSGGALGAAIAKDLAAIERNIKSQPRYMLDDSEKPVATLCKLFNWNQSPEGHVYWANRDIGCQFYGT